MVILDLLQVIATVVAVAAAAVNWVLSEYLRHAAAQLTNRAMRMVQEIRII